MYTMTTLRPLLIALVLVSCRPHVEQPPAAPNAPASQNTRAAPGAACTPDQLQELFDDDIVDSARAICDEQTPGNEPVTRRVQALDSHAAAALGELKALCGRQRTPLVSVCRLDRKARLKVLDAWYEQATFVPTDLTTMRDGLCDKVVRKGDDAATKQEDDKLHNDLIARTKEMVPAPDQKAVTEALEALRLNCSQTPAPPLEPDQLARVAAMLETPDAASFPEHYRTQREATTGSERTDEDLRRAREAETASRGGAAAAALGTFLDTSVAGLARFLEARAKAEVQLFVIDRIRQEVCDDANAKVFAPHMCSLLGTGADSVFAPSFGQNLRAAFEADLRGLPRVLLSEVGTDGGRDVLLARLTAEVLVGLVESTEPIAITEQLSEVARAWNCTDASDKSCEQLKNAATRASLLLQAYFDHAFMPTDTGGSNAATAAIEALVATILGSDALTMDQQIELEKIERAVLEMARIVKELNDGPPTSGNEAPSDAERDRWRIRRVVSFGREMVGAVNVALRLGSAQEGARSWAIPPVVGDALEAYLERDYGRVFVSLLAVVPSGIAKGRPPEKVVRVLAFGAELAQAKTADDAEAAIDAFAAPVGSWRLKSEDRGIALNAWVGGVVGRELLVSKGVSGGALSAGVTAPVGLDIFYGLGPVHLGLFLPIVDVGNFIQFRASNKADLDPNEVPSEGGQATAPDVEASTSPSDNPLQLLAPGAYLRVGFREVPIIVGAGASYVPSARNVRGDGFDEDIAAVRIQGLAAVDVPILIF